MRTVSILTLAGGLIVGATLVGAGPAGATGTAADRGANRTTIAVIGDTPYGADQTDPALFGGLLADINADPKVRTVLHVGDIKNGGTPCTDAYFEQIATNFEASKAPVIYTPGDNEWTDCHRPTAGSYDPYERLDALRDTFFPASGRALGRRPIGVTSQGGEFLENVMWTESRVAFSTVHVVGSDNGAVPWSAPLETPANAAIRAAEVARREQAAISWIDATFDAATAQGALGVVVSMQADTFFGGVVGPAFASIIGRLGERAAAFDGPVLLIQGDSHRYTVDQPVPQAPNLTRIIIEGETVGEWLRLTIDPRAPALFTWERITR